MKLEAYDSVVILSPFHWNFRDDMWQTTHHIAREFSRLCPTVLVEPAVQWNARAEHFRVYRLLNCLVGSQTRSPSENLVVFRRRSLPLGRFKTIRDFDLRRNARTLREFLSKCGFQRTLLWHSFPYWSERLIEAVDHTLFAYHCLDHTTREEETELVRRADAVFCVSESLVRKHRALNPHVGLLPNGVDLQLFNHQKVQVSERPRDLPAEGQLVGFVGTIDCHLDFELLINIAHAFPSAYLIILGYIAGERTGPQGSQREALAKLSSLKNVRMLGFRSVDQLPAYVNAFDVCLIPLCRDEFNQERDPAKFYQYAALGKPIVSAPVSVALRHRDLCYVVESPEEFIRCVSDALTEPNGAALSQKRIRLARSYSWESIVARACELLRQIVESRQSELLCPRS